MTSDSAIVAGGCFWGVEDLLRKVNGITDTEVGYTGGTLDHPTYEKVKTGTTGHAEAIDISFDPKIISYEKVLELFFQLHDPTTRNRQGGDIGTQYRSAIFPRDADQQAIAERVIAKENASGRWPKPLATTIEEFKIFYSAESYHQDYLLKNPGGYTCHFWRGPTPT